MLFDIEETGEHHDDVIKWKHFLCNWLFVRGIHLSPVNSPHKGQWRGILMFSLIGACTNGWVNNRDAGDLKRHSAHSDVVIIMVPLCIGVRVNNNYERVASIDGYQFRTTDPRIPEKLFGTYCGGERAKSLVHDPSVINGLQTELYLPTVLERGEHLLLDMTPWSLQWRYNECDCVTNQGRLDCLRNRLLRSRSKKYQSSTLLHNTVREDSPHKGSITRRYFHMMMSSWWFV